MGFEWVLSLRPRLMICLIQQLTSKGRVVYLMVGLFRSIFGVRMQSLRRLRILPFKLRLKLRKQEEETASHPFSEESRSSRSFTTYNLPFPRVWRRGTKASGVAERKHLDEGKPNRLSKLHLPIEFKALKNEVYCYLFSFFFIISFSHFIF